MSEKTQPHNYRPVIFHDNTSGARFLIASAVETKETGKWEDGKEYPLFHVEISSASHPFYTGQETVVDTAGRVQKFKAKREQAEKAKKVIKEQQAARAERERDRQAKKEKAEKARKKGR